MSNTKGRETILLQRQFFHHCLLTMAMLNVWPIRRLPIRFAQFLVPCLKILGLFDNFQKTH